MQIRTAATCAAILAVVFTLGVGPRAAQSVAVPRGCTELNLASGQYGTLLMAIQARQQRVRDLGLDFTVRVPEFESEAEFFRDLTKREPVFRQAKAAALDFLLESVKENIQELKPADMAVLAAKVERLPRVGKKFSEQLIDIAKTPPGGEARLIKWNTAM
jgi:hypothetical protein